jgi:hypothetical protein
MILKAQEDSRADIAMLARLMRHRNADETCRRRIEEQIRNLRSGDRGEAEAAYEIDFHYGNSPDWVIIHDLRIEHGGYVAQIDHLLINRVLEFWVCESKRFAGGLKINAQGEFVTFYEGRPQGRPSPIEQNNRHMKVLQAVIAAGSLNLPTRLGLTLRPSLKSLILISHGSITRPRTPVPQIETVIKNDQLRSTITRSLDKVGFTGLAKLIGPATLHDLGRQVLALHRPITRRWAAQFGLTPIETSTPVVGPWPTTPTVVCRRIGAAPPPAGLPSCASCGCGVTAGIVAYCARDDRFARQVYCIKCQATAPQPATAIA